MEFKKGDEVAWNTSQGKTEGKVTQKLTRPKKLQAHQVTASADQPQYEVKSHKTGKTAAHKPDSLERK